MRQARSGGIDSQMPLHKKQFQKTIRTKLPQNSRLSQRRKFCLFTRRPAPVIVNIIIGKELNMPQGGATSDENSSQHPVSLSSPRLFRLRSIQACGSFSRVTNFHYFLQFV